MTCLFSFAMALALISCGAAEDSTMNRTLSPTATTVTHDWMNTVTNYTVERVDDCVQSAGQCGGVYYMTDKVSVASEFKATVRAILSNDYWVNHDFDNPEQLSFNCRFQTCTGNDCMSNFKKKDSTNMYWKNGTTTSVVINQTDASHTKDFQISHMVAANSYLRIFCNYHWGLDYVIPPNTTNSAPRITGISFKYN